MPFFLINEYFVVIKLYLCYDFMMRSGKMPPFSLHSRNGKLLIENYMYNNVTSIADPNRFEVQFKVNTSLKQCLMEHVLS